MFPTFYIPSVVESAEALDIKLLLHGEGADGSTTFTDSSTYNRVPTVFGTPEIDTAQKKFGSASIRLKGYPASDYLAYGPSTDFDLTADENWTVECFVRWNAITIRDHVWEFGTNVNNRFVLFIDWSGTGKLYFTKIVSGAGTSVLDSNVLTAGVWYHVCMMRKGSTIYCFVNGVLSGTLSATPMFSGAVELFIGHQPYPTNFNEDYLDGWIDEFRYIVGAAIYPITGFTPPTSPHPDP